MYKYKAKIIRVVDGDTVDVDIDLGFGVWLNNQRIRLYGIDTPECRTRDKVESYSTSNSSSDSNSNSYRNGNIVIAIIIRTTIAKAIAKQ